MLWGFVIVIKRNGTDGSTFPMVNEECLLGRGEGCDIRIQLPVVSKEHARIKVQAVDQKVYITALSKTNATKLNDNVLENEVPHILHHSDLFTIGDRHFRWEFPKASPHFTKAPERDPVEESMATLPAPFVPSSPSTETAKEEAKGITKRLAELEAATPSTKRVSFGPAVTPELIDKTLPPDTPVRKGSVPAGGTESPRPDSLARSLAIRRTTAKRVSAKPIQGSISEEVSPTRGVLKRPATDPEIPTTKASSGHRSSPRRSSLSPVKVPKLEVTPATPIATPLLSTEVSAPLPVVPPKKLKAGDAPKTPKTFYGAAAASRKTPVLPKTPASTRVKQESRSVKGPSKAIKRKSAISPPKESKKAKASSKKIPEKETNTTDKAVPVVKTPKTFYGAGAGARKTPVLAKTPAPQSKSEAGVLKAKAEPAKTPKVTKMPKAVIGRTPKVLATRGRTPKARPLWSEIVARQGKAKTPKQVTARAVAVAERPVVKKAKVLGTPKKHRAVLNLQSTGHAASPETLVIRGKRRSGVKVQVKEITPANASPIKVAAKIIAPANTANPGKVGTPVKVGTPSKIATPAKAVTPKPATPKPSTPKAATPKVATPKVVTPKPATPAKATTKAATPAKATPKAATHAKSTLKAATPAKATPKAATPAKATPKAATPAKATPKAATPAKATPKAATPAKATPKAATPARATPKAETPAKAEVATPAKATPKAATPAKVSTPSNVSAKKSTPKGDKHDLETPKTVRRAAVSGVTPMVNTPVSGSTPKVSTPRDEVLDSPKANKTSPKKGVKALKTPKTDRKKALGLKTPRTIGKTPKVPKSVKKATLWSEVVMKNLGKTPKKGAKVASVKVKVKKVKKTKVSKTPRKVKTASTSSTGHANSPETITITKKAKTPKKTVDTPRAKTPKSPRVATPKTPKVETPPVKTPKAVTPKVKTPKADTPKAEKLSTPENQVQIASAKKSSEKRFPKRLSHVGTHAVLSKVSTPDNKHLSKVRGTPRSARVSKGSPSTPFLASQLSQSLSSTPGQLNVTDFDFESQPTPRVPLSALVSPLSNSSKSRRGRKQRGGGEELTVASMSTTPIADYTNVSGIRKLLKTPGLPPKSPMNDLTNVAGVKGLMRTPRAQVGPKNDLTDVKGVKQMMATPKTHKQQKDDLTDVQGVKKLMATPKVQKEPKNDLTNVQGVKKIMATPKTQEGPKNDLSNVGGVKKLMATPKPTKGPRNELDDLRGVKNLVGTPKTDKGPRNELDDLRGVKDVLGTPNPPPNTPVNDLSDLRGVKELVGTPRQQKEAANVLEDLRGVKSLLKTPKAVATEEDAVVDFTGVADLVATPALVEPSTSKRKVDSSLERSSSKKARVAEESEATTSRVARSPAKSPTKTARGTGSPGVTIPKFDLSGAENQENIPPADLTQAAVVKSIAKRGGGRKAEEPVVESVEVEAEIVTKVLEEVKYDKMLKKDLLAECVKKGLEVDGKSTKAVIIAALRASTNENHKELEMPVENTVEDENVENTTTGRGRKGRVAVALQEEQQKVATPVKKGRVPVVLEEEKEARIVTPVKTTRGKKVMKEAVVDQEQAVTVEKPKRGRGKKVEEKEHVETVKDKEESTSKPEESSSQRRRGRKTKESPSPSQIPTEAPSLVEDPASPALKAAAKPKRGAKKGKAKVERVAAADIPEPSSDPCGTCKKAKRGITWDCQVEGGEVSEEEAAVPVPVEVVEQPKRGGRRKLALAEVEEEEVSEKVEQAEQVEEAEQVEVEAPAKKAAGRRKAVAAIEEVAVVAPSPVKRGRRGAAPVQEKEEVKEKSPVRRGRKAAVEKTVTEEASAPVVSSPMKKGRKANVKQALVEEASPLQPASPARKGRKGKALPAEVETAEAEKKEEVVKEKEEEAKVEKKKGGRKAKSAPAIVETTNESEEAPVVRKGRAASKAATEKIANDVKELSNLGAKKRRPDEDEAKKSQEEKESSAPPAKRSTRARK